MAFRFTAILLILSINTRVLAIVSVPRGGPTEDVVTTHHVIIEPTSHPVEVQSLVVRAEHAHPVHAPSQSVAVDGNGDAETVEEFELSEQDVPPVVTSSHPRTPVVIPAIHPKQESSLVQKAPGGVLSLTVQNAPGQSPYFNSDFSGDGTIKGMLTSMVLPQAIRREEAHPAHAAAPSSSAHPAHAAASSSSAHRPAHPAHATAEVVSSGKAQKSRARRQWDASKRSKDGVALDKAPGTVVKNSTVVHAEPHKDHTREKLRAIQSEEGFNYLATIMSMSLSEMSAQVLPKGATGGETKTHVILVCLSVGVAVAVLACAGAFGHFFERTVDQPEESLDDILNRGRPIITAPGYQRKGALDVD